MRELIKAINATILQSGIFPGLNAESAPLWADGDNIIFREGGVRKQAGYVAAVDFGATISRIEQARVLGVNRLYAGSATSLFRWDGTSVVTIGSGYTSDDWSLATWGTWITATNGTDVPVVDKNTGTAVPMNVPFTTAAIFKKHGPHLLAFNTDNIGENAFEWCDADDLDDWDASSTTNSAGNLPIRKLESEIIAVAELGDILTVYGNDQCFAVSYQGSPFYYGQRILLNGIGAVSKHSVVTQGRRNWGIDQRGIWVTDGVTYEYADEPAFRTWLKENMNWDAKAKITGFLDETNQLVIWNIPTGSSAVADKAIAVDFKTGAMTKFDYAFTHGLPKEVFSTGIAVVGQKAVYLNTGADADGTALVAWVQTKPMDAGDDNVYKLWQLLKISIRDGVDLLIDSGFQDNLDDPIEWQGYVPAERFNYNHRSSVYVSYRFKSTKLGAKWLVNTFAVDGARGGKR